VHNPKEVSGRRAADEVKDGMTLGLGTGSTVYFALVRIGERLREEGLTLRCVPTSVDTEEKARQLGIPLATLEEVERIDLTIDGADEVDPDLQLIKGGGGALLREKVVASISKKVLIVVGRDKLVSRLGASFLLPVEVVPFARPTVRRALVQLGCAPILRVAGHKQPYITDNGNLILDCHFEGGIPDPRGLELELARIPGIVESGLFIDLAQAVIVGEADGTSERIVKPAG
jgi:ribose 5-phosphate isomerase A